MDRSPGAFAMTYIERNSLREAAAVNPDLRCPFCGESPIKIHWMMCPACGRKLQRPAPPQPPADVSPVEDAPPKQPPAREFEAVRAGLRGVATRTSDVSRRFNQRMSYG